MLHSSAAAEISLRTGHPQATAFGRTLRGGWQRKGGGGQDRTAFIAAQAPSNDVTRWLTCLVVGYYRLLWSPSALCDAVVLTNRLAVGRSLQREPSSAACVAASRAAFSSATALYAAEARAACLPALSSVLMLPKLWATSSALLTAMPAQAMHQQEL